MRRVLLVMSVALMQNMGAEIVAPAKITPVKLESPVLRLIDGTSFVDIASMVHFARNIYQLETTGHVELIDSVTREHFERILTLRGCPCSLQHIVQAHTQNPQDPAVQQALKEALDIFADMSRPYLAEVKSAKEYMMRLIKVWSEVRSRPDSDMLGWAACNDDEESSFYYHMDSPERFYQFLEDLRCFLVDMMKTCEKSWKLYDEMRRGINRKNPPHESA